MGDREKTFTFSHERIWSKFTSAHVVVPLLKPPPHSSDLHHIHQPHKKKQYQKNSLLSFMKAITQSTSLLSLHCTFLTSWKCKDAAKAPAAVFNIQKESLLHLFGAVKRQQSF